MNIDETARIENSTLGDVEIREYVTVHDSEIATGCRIYERTSIKKSDIDGPTDINANAYVENARIGTEVQVGPNAVVGAGVTVTEDVAAGTVVRDGR
jgi:UDP-2-acetamido-3-amino-2,3-dideoxy-glucuronate N-acetyltransferase